MNFTVLLLSRERAQASIQYSVYNPDDPEVKRQPRRATPAERSLEVLTLRGLANRGKIRSTDPALNNLVALPNELICQVLAFWFG